jgi:2-polyprenyl-3-methyl-5-hydroxy-6-metoxy-1,4-benzoquinol methylase
MRIMAFPHQKADWPAWRCPVHHESLLRDRKALVCPAGDSFPISKGIPRFVPDSDYAAAFGLQWQKYRLTQLDSYSGTRISLARLRRCLGEDLWRALPGKQVLECGCGAGRFTEILLTQGAYATSVDLSEAVEANMQNCPASETHRGAQADILQLPFAPGQFDVVLCLGVIQHTPCPEETIAQLAAQLRPGGWLVIDHYTHSLAYYTKSSLVLRPILKRLSPEHGLKWTERLVDIWLPLHKRVRRLRPAQMLLSRLSPVLAYYHALPELSDEIHREWALLDTHDSLTDWFKHFRTRKQIRRTLEGLGLQEVWCEYGGNGVEARARRPLRGVQQVRSSLGESFSSAPRKFEAVR